MKNRNLAFIGLIAALTLPVLAGELAALPAGAQRVHVPGAGPAGVLVTGPATPLVVAPTPGAALGGNGPSAATSLPGAVGVAKAKKPPVAPGGVWRWTTYNRSLQPIENVLTLSVDKKGVVTGKLVDRAGEHEVKNVTVGAGTVSFDLPYHSRGIGDFAHTFTVNLDPDNPGVSVDRPDLSPAGRAAGKKRHEDHNAKHDPAG